MSTEEKMMNLKWLLRLAQMLLACGFGLALAANAQPAGAAASGACTHCGVVLSVRHVEEQGRASGVGAVAGGVLGGIVGHQFGSGRGNTAATIVGAGAGAYAGHQIEKNRNRKAYWSVAVRLDNGKKRTFTFGNRPAFRDGDRVKLAGGGKRLALVAN
jgi:outer membrane lipoprotein SlyB